MENAETWNEIRKLVLILDTFGRGQDRVISGFLSEGLIGPLKIWADDS